jgi:hypothetical protein
MLPGLERGGKELLIRTAAVPADWGLAQTSQQLTKGSAELVNAADGDNILFDANEQPEDCMLGDMPLNFRTRVSTAEGWVCSAPGSRGRSLPTKEDCRGLCNA